MWEQDYVHKFYSKHASDFNITRNKTWPKIAEFLNNNDKPGMINLDAGCGNGRNLKRGGESVWMGLDYSHELLKCILNRNIIDKSMDGGDIKNDKSVDNDKSLDNNSTTRESTDITSFESLLPFTLTRGDCLSLPFRSSSFDLILSIAVIHHFSSYERRLRALQEMHRILKDGGKILLYVWDEKTKHKPKFKQIQGKDYLVKFNGVDRYYYLFDEEELIKICIESGFKVEESGIEQESIYIILNKV